MLMNNTRKILIISLILIIAVLSSVLVGCKDKKTVVNSQDDLIGSWQSDNDATFYFVFSKNTFTWDGVICYYTYNKEQKTITYSYTQDGPIEKDYIEVLIDDKGNTYLKSSIGKDKFYKVKD